MTDKEMVEWRKIFIRDTTSAFSKDYKRLEKKFEKYAKPDYDAKRKYYWNICMLVDNDVPDEEILSMTNEERLTYQYLFELNYKTF